MFCLWSLTEPSFTLKTLDSTVPLRKTWMALQTTCRCVPLSADVDLDQNARRSLIGGYRDISHCIHMILKFPLQIMVRTWMENTSGRWVEVCIAWKTRRNKSSGGFIRYGTELLICFENATGKSEWNCPEALFHKCPGVEQDGTN